MKSKRRRWRRFHQFPRRVPHPVNPAARGPTSSQPVGVGVPDDPFLRPLRTSPRSAAPRRGGVPSPPGHGITAGVRKSRGLRAAGPPAKGEPPARVPPVPPPALCEHKESSARCGARPWAPPLDLARFFVKKRGKKLLLGQTFASPNPSPWRRVIQSVRKADTLAAEWHLPREWERRVGPETSRGRHHPKRFSLGLHPVSLGKTKEMGWNRQHQRKETQQQNGEFLQRPTLTAWQCQQ